MLNEELIEMVQCAIDHDCAKNQSKRCAICEIGFKAFAEEPLLLTCGHIICKKCKNGDKVNCSKHGEAIVGLEAKMNCHFIEMNKKQLFETTKEKYENAASLLKGRINIFVAIVLKSFFIYRIRR